MAKRLFDWLASSLGSYELLLTGKVNPEDGGSRSESES